MGPRRGFRLHSVASGDRCVIIGLEFILYLINYKKIDINYFYEKRLKWTYILLKNYGGRDRDPYYSFLLIVEINALVR